MLIKHKEQITHEQYRHLQVSKHLAECSQGKGKVKVMPIYQYKGESKIKIECVEKQIISLLKRELSFSV